MSNLVVTQADRERAKTFITAQVRQWMGSKLVDYDGPLNIPADEIEVLATEYASIRADVLEAAAKHFDRRLTCAACGCETGPMIGLQRCVEKGTTCDGTLFGPPISLELRALADGTLTFDKGEG